MRLTRISHCSSSYHTNPSSSRWYLATSRSLISPCPPAPSLLSSASHSIPRSESPIRQLDQFRHVLQRLICQFHYCSFQESLVERQTPRPFGGSPRAAGWLGDGIRSSRRRPTGVRPCRRQPHRSWRRCKSARPGPPSTGVVRERQQPHRRRGHPCRPLHRYRAAGSKHGDGIVGREGQQSIFSHASFLGRLRGFGVLT